MFRLQKALLDAKTAADIAERKKLIPVFFRTQKIARLLTGFGYIYYKEDLYRIKSLVEELEKEYDWVRDEKLAKLIKRIDEYEELCRHETNPNITVAVYREIRFEIRLLGVEDLNILHNLLSRINGCDKK